MKRNAIGAVVSVRSIAEFGGQYMSCLCAICGEVFTPSDTEDCNGLPERTGPDGEMPLSCDRCYDEKQLNSGIGILDLTDPSNPTFRAPHGED